MRVLIACEFSGVVRNAFNALNKNHEVWSCDLLPTESPGLHYQGDILDILDGWTPVRHTWECDPKCEGVCRLTNLDISECKCYGPAQDDIEYKKINGKLFGRPKKHPHWDLMIAHPPCIYLCSSGMHWTIRGLRDPQLTEDALDFVNKLLNAPIEKIALENPVGVISTRIRKPNQIIQPWMFGHDASKKTCLWLKGLPLLEPTEYVPPRVVNGKNRWGNQTDSGQNKLGPSKTRARERSVTYQGIAKALAVQFTAFIESGYSLDIWDKLHISEKNRIFAKYM